MGSGCGPGGSFVEFWVWYSFLKMKMRMVALTKVIPSRSVGYSMALYFAFSFCDIHIYKRREPP
jgi:hypothetical protein